MPDLCTQSNLHDALEKRYGQQTDVPQDAPWNDTIANLLNHRSVRRYKDTAPPAGTLQMLVAAAQSAATSSNLQCWSAISVTDPGLRQQLASIAGDQAHVEQCPIFLVWLCDLSRHERIGRAHNTDLARLTLTENFIVGMVDAALAAQNAVVAAESLGLSTVYIGGLRNDPEAVAKLLRLPQGVVASFGLCVGYADVPSAVKPRLPQDVVLFENHYGTEDEASLCQQYDKTLATYSRRHDMKQHTWTERILGRLSESPVKGKRVEMRAILERLGFPLR